MSDTITLRRSGQPPLTFTGALIGEADGERVCGKEQSRFHELRVYRTDGGQYVLSIAWRTRYEGELDNDLAVILDAPGHVAANLQEYDPCAYCRGYPRGEHYDRKQEYLMSDLRQRYDDMVSDLLASDPAFAERID